MDHPISMSVHFDSSHERDAPQAIALMQDVDGVLEVRPEQKSADGRAGEVLDFSRVLIAIAPEAVRSAISAIASIFTLPGSPNVKLKISVKGSVAEFDFNPRYVTGDELIRITDKVVATLKAGSARRD